jgi:hypothetical protein
MSADIAERLADLNPYEFFGFASYLEGRTNGVGTNYGEFKRHKTLGHAKSAIAHWNGRNGTRRLYRWDTELEEWAELSPVTT